MAPLTVGKSWNVTVDTWVRAATRCLHGAEAIQREYRRNIQRHRLNEVDGQALAVSIGKLVEILQDGTRRVLDDLGARAPDQAGNIAEAIQVGDVVGEKLFPLPLANGVGLRAVLHDLLAVHGRKNAPQDNRNLRRSPLHTPSHALGSWIGSRRKE